MISVDRAARRGIDINKGFVIIVDDTLQNFLARLSSNFLQLPGSSEH